MAPSARGGLGNEVIAVVRAAERLVKRADNFVSAVANETGLSPAGVLFALKRTVEREPRAEELSSLLASVETASEATVVLSRTVFIAAIRALALGLLAAPFVRLRPSRRAPTFARELVKEVSRELGERRLALVEDVDFGALASGVVHAYGRDETLRELRNLLPSGVRLWGHGAGFGIACASDVKEASRLAEDMVLFDGQGCLSPRLAFVRGDEGEAQAFADALAQSLEAFAHRVPSGTRPALADVDTAHMLGSCLHGHGHAVLVLSEGERPWLFPPGRCVTLMACQEESSLTMWMDRLSGLVTTVGIGESGWGQGSVPRSARRARIGAMQRPPLDGPVDLRGNVVCGLRAR